MNWFERYGIPGIYFGMLSVEIHFALVGLPIYDKAAVIIGAVVMGSVPIGYVLVVASQVLYYRFGFLQVHRPAWNAVVNKWEKREWKVEADSTVPIRWRIGHERSDQGRWMQEWFMKRFDVLSINLAIVVGTGVAWGSTLLWHKEVLNTQIRWNVNLSALLIVSLGVVGIVTANSIILTRQARSVATSFYKQLARENPSHFIVKTPVGEKAGLESPHPGAD